MVICLCILIAKSIISSHNKKGRWLSTGDKGTAALVQQSHSRVDWALLQLFVFESDAHVLAVERKGERALLHVEVHSQSTLFLEPFTVFWTDGSVAVAELAGSVVGPATRVV